MDLIHLGTRADADEIKDTARTQPLLVAAALLAAEHLPMHDVALVAGHSVGELGAAALAGVLPAEAAVTLAGVRGREMAAACALEPTGMAAVLGGDPDEVLAALEAHGLHPANRNGAGQIVAAGASTGWTSSPPNRRPAPGSSGSRWPARSTRRTWRRPRPRWPRVAAGVTASAPARILLSNLDGAPVGHGPETLQRLVRQVTAPVRWDLCMRTLADLGVTGVIELPPAGTLAGLVKRELKGEGAPEIVTLNTPADLPAARRPDRPARRSRRPPDRAVRSGWSSPPPPAASPGRPRRRWAPRYAPARSSATSPRAQGPVEVTAHDNGLLTEWLAHHDDPVAPGQPLVRIGGTH